MRFSPRFMAILCGTTLLVAGLVLTIPHPSPTRPTLITPRAAANGEDWFMLTRRYPTGRPAAANALTRAMTLVSRSPQTMGSPAPALALPGQSWISIGPSPIAPSVFSALPWAGRVTALAPHPTRATTLYIGTDGGGIWRTTDGGTTWTPLTDTLPVPAIQSLAIDPVNPSLLYATTINRTYGPRLLRSTDGGDTWSTSSIVTDQGQTLSPSLCSVNVLKACIPSSTGQLFFDPTRAGSATASTIFFVGTSHLLRSDDSGMTFHVVLALPTDLDFAGPTAAAENPEALYLRDATIDPTRPTRLFAVVAQPHCASADCSLLTSTLSAARSLDGGVTWDQQTLGTLPTSIFTTTRYADPGPIYVPRARVAVAPSGPDTVAIAYRDEASGASGRPHVFWSTDGGTTWTERTQPANETWPLGLIFSPTDANTLYLSSDDIYRSMDSGQTWTAFNTPHADNIALAFDANGTLLIGGDGGLFVNPSGTTLSTMNTGLVNAELYSIAADPANALVLAAGAQDNGVVMFQGALGWRPGLFGDGGDTVFDPNARVQLLYTENQWYLDHGSNDFGFYVCSSTCVVAMKGFDLTLNGPFIPRIALDAATPATLWLTAERLFRTDNQATTWTAASPSAASDARCWQDPVQGPLCASAAYFTAVAVAPSSSQVVYAGTLNGDVWLTMDRGTTWATLAGPNAGPLPVRSVTDIVVDPLDARIAYVAFSGFDSGGSGTGHLFRTPDSGRTWQDLTANLPDIPVNTILIDPDSLTSTSSSRVLYLGTDIGVFQATLTGTTPAWQPFGTGLPPVVVTRLAYSAATQQLFAATYGRGVWAITSRFVR